MKPSVSGIVFDDAGSILLVRQRDIDLWSSRGGAMEPDETAADAVARELWEETGLLTRPLDFLASTVCARSSIATGILCRT